MNAHVRVYILSPSVMRHIYRSPVGCWELFGRPGPQQRLSSVELPMVLRSSFCPFKLRRACESSIARWPCPVYNELCGNLSLLNFLAFQSTLFVEPRPVSLTSR